jgi:hypothetical protein
MARTRVVKLKNGFQRFDLQDLHSRGKFSNGEKLAFAVKRRKGRFKLVKGTVFVSWPVYCECCGPEFCFEFVKSDGTVVAKWGL